MHPVVIAIIVVSSFLASAGAVAAEPVIPASIKSSLDSYEADTLRAYQAYKSAAAKAAEKSLKDMDLKLKAATKSGNLDLANAIKAEMDRLAKGETLTSLEEKWRDAESADLLGDTSGKSRLVIISAKYGTASETVDITDYLQGKVANNELIIPRIHWETLAREGIQDPAPGERKSITVIYETRGGKRSVTIDEYQPLIITPKK